MEHQIYCYSLCVSLTLLIFFGCYFIFGKLPRKHNFETYRISRSVMGFALLTLAVNYSVHLFVQPRFFNPDAAIFINLSTYYLDAWLFSLALTILLDRTYLTRRKFIFHVASWVVFTLFFGVAFLLSEGVSRKVILLCMALIFGTYALILSYRLYRTYRRAVRAFDDYHSDNIAIYIRWMSRFTYWAVVYGVAVGLLTFLPDEYIFLWIIISIPFFIYLFSSYMNYMLVCEQASAILESEMSWEKSEISREKIEMGREKSEMGRGESEKSREKKSEMSREKERSLNQQPLPVVEPGLLAKEDSEGDAIAEPPYYSDISDKMTLWIRTKGYVEQGLTITQLSEKLQTNRTYLSHYINASYHTSFRVWISSLRIEYAKELLVDHPEMTIAQIADQCGYTSVSHFTATFTDLEECSPRKWRKMQQP